MMRRREFITLLVGAAAAWPIAARQAAGDADTSHRGTASRIRRQLAISDLDWCLPAGLGTIRFDHGRNVRIDTRWAGANADAIRHHIRNWLRSHRT